MIVVVWRVCICALARVGHHHWKWMKRDGWPACGPHRQQCIMFAHTKYPLSLLFFGVRIVKCRLISWAWRPSTTARRMRLYLFNAIWVLRDTFMWDAEQFLFVLLGSVLVVAVCVCLWTKGDGALCWAFDRGALSADWNEWVPTTEMCSNCMRRALMALFGD